jgi:hypothetical protein
MIKVVPDFQNYISNSVIKQLFEASNIDALVALAGSEKLFPRFLRILVDVFLVGTEPEALVGYCVMQRIPDLDERLDLCRYDAAYQLFNLERRDPVVFVKKDKLVAHDKRRYRARSLEMAFFGAASLEPLASGVLPKLIENNDMDGVTELMHLIRPADDSVSAFVRQSIADIYAYLLVCCERSQAKKGFEFLSEVFTATSAVLMIANMSSIAPLLLLHVGQPDREVRDQVRAGIGIVVRVIEGDKYVSQNLETRFRAFWLQHILPALHSFADVLRENRVGRSALVVRSLRESLVDLQDDLIHYYPKIVSLVGTAMKSRGLQLECLRFWDKFVEVVGHEGTLKTLFGHIVSQVLPCYDEHPAEAKSVLTRLICDREEAARDCFEEITHLPFFSEKADLARLSSKLGKAASDCDWRDQIHRLSFQLRRESSQSFRRLLLQQLLLLLKYSRDVSERNAETIRALEKEVERSRRRQIGRTTNCGGGGRRCGATTRRTVSSGRCQRRSSVP